MNDLTPFWYKEYHCYNGHPCVIILIIRDEQGIITGPFNFPIRWSLRGDKSTKEEQANRKKWRTWEATPAIQVYCQNESYCAEEGGWT